MAEEDSDVRQDGKRYTDVTKEPDKPLPPLQKFTNQPSFGLQDATKGIEKFVDDLPAYVTLSLNKCKYPKDGLTQNESAALYLYSLQWPKDKHSFYTLFNRALRNEDRTKLIPYHNYLHLFMVALRKLPSVQDRVWRGVNGDISGQYEPKSVHVWWGASSCSDMVHVTDTFLNKNDHRTLFNIKCSDGKIIKNHSAFPKESEVVLPPGTCLKVRSVSNPAPKLYIIDMEQIPYEEPSSAGSAVDHRVGLIWLDGSVNTSENISKVLEKWKHLNTTIKTFEQFDQCETFIHQIKTNCRIILIVSGRIGREIIGKVHDFSQLVTVFVFCGNKIEHEKWAKNYHKVKAVIVSSEDLVKQVKEEVAIQMKQAEQNNETISAASSAGRFTDAHNELLSKTSILEGYQHMPLVSLKEALQPVSDLLGKDWKMHVFIAKENCKNPVNGLTADESAAIMIYTMEWSEYEFSLYRVLNETLRTEDRLKVKPWFSYMKLMITALYKLPSVETTVWRSVQLDLTKNFQKGGTYTWWSFSTTTTEMESLESAQFMGKHGARTLFSIQCIHGKDIQKHSFFQSEKEILLMPGFHFTVLSRMDTGNGLSIINIKEIKPLFPLLPSPFGV